jgi:hypothetical protein
LYAAFGRGDIAGVLAGLAADIEWIDEGPEVVSFCGTYRGPAQVGSFFQKLDASLEFDEFTASAFVAEGDRVVVLGHYKYRAKPTGKRSEGDFAHSWVIRDGKAARFQAFGDTAALGAAFTR